MIFLKYGILLLVFLFAGSTQLRANDAEVYWAAFEDGQAGIMLSEYNDEAWSDPRSIYNTETELTSLAVATEENGTKILVWTELRGQKMVLMKMQKADGAQEWSQPSLFNDDFTESFASTLVKDSRNQLWLFWSANKGGRDDIFLSRRVAEGWSKPERIHNENKVPDITPVAFLDENQNVVVEWLSYDYVASDYIRLSRTYVVEPAVKIEDDQPKSGVNNIPESPKPKELEVSTLKLPGFLSDGAFGVAHFPNNQFRQSERIFGR